jgi:hypothetical protein
MEDTANVFTEMRNKPDFQAMRNKGMLLTPSNEQTGLTCPKGYKLIRCNLDQILFMEWDPIGEWEPTPNQVLRLTKSPCELTIHKIDGTEMRFSFQENDFRYMVNDKWLIIYSQKKVELKKPHR